MTPDEYKQARHTLGLSQPEWLAATGISESNHKKYTGGFREVPATTAYLIRALMMLSDAGLLGEYLGEPASDDG